MGNEDIGESCKATVFYMSLGFLDGSYINQNLETDDFFFFSEKLLLLDWMYIKSLSLLQMLIEGMQLTK